MTDEKSDHIDDADLPTITEEMPAVYANRVQVLTRPFDITFLFSYELPSDPPFRRSGTVVSITPQLAKQMLELLEAHLDDYVERMGPIPSVSPLQASEEDEESDEEG